MKFGSKGNLYLYEPGAGISGEPHRVIELGSDEVIYENKENVQEIVESKPNVAKVESMHRIVPKKAASVTR